MQDRRGHCPEVSQKKALDGPLVAKFAVYNLVSMAVPQVSLRQAGLFDGEPYASIELVGSSRFGGAVVSLFSGAGGLDLGLEACGFETLCCVEIDQDSRTTLQYNRPEWKLIDGNGVLPGDIRGVSGDDILSAIELKRGEVAVVAGGPPCQSFSNLGLKRGRHDPVNGDLYEHYLRLVEEIFPHAVIFENVEGFNHRQHDDVRQVLLRRLEELGYSLSSGVVVSADYGDPQIRRRFVILGCRHGRTPKLPAPTHFESREAYKKFFIGHELVQPEFRQYRTVGEAFSMLTQADLLRDDYRVMNVSQVVEERMKLVGPGQNFKALPDEILPDCWKSGRHQGSDTFGRLRLDRPSVTIRTSAYNPAKGRYIHPIENRGLSTREMAVLQSFPDDYIFRCHQRGATLVGIGRMIGNAVPIKLASALGKSIRLALGLS
jgi:DNA (cytosine-5)-methyltransferase 1